MQTSPNSEPVVMLAARVPAQLRYDLKYAATVTNTPMQELVRRAIESYLQNAPIAGAKR